MGIETSKVFPVILLTFVVGAVAGCGSSSKDATTSSSATYTSAAAAICMAAFDKANAQTLPTTSAEAKEVQTNSAAIFNAAVEKLSQVDVPADADTKFNAWPTDFKAIPAANEAAAADQGLMSSAFAKTGVQFEAAVAKANASAKAAGLPVCELTK